MASLKFHVFHHACRRLPSECDVVLFLTDVCAFLYLQVRNTAFDVLAGKTGTLGEFGSFRMQITRRNDEMVKAGPLRSKTKPPEMHGSMLSIC